MTRRSAAAPHDTTAPIVLWSHALLTPKASLHALHTSVATIADAAAKERWLLNVTMWRLRLRHPSTADGPGLAKMQATLGAARAAAAAAADPAEQARWQANCDLWEAELSHGESTAERSKMRFAVAALKSEITRNTSGAELLRWLANHDLWRSVIDPKPPRRPVPEPAAPQIDEGA